MSDITLRVKHTIPASPDRLFDLWTDPKHVVRWWGPRGVDCCAAELDLRVGGAYRIGNEFDDGTIVWISGVFVSIERPNRLSYTWHVNDSDHEERVTVQFIPRGDVTDVVVEHTRIIDEATRKTHRMGWIGCLEGLELYAAHPPYGAA